MAEEIVVPPDCPRCGFRMDLLMAKPSKEQTFYACAVCPPPWRLDSSTCDACAFLLAVRPCPACGRPLCLDCLESHICARFIRPKIGRRPRR